MAGVYLVEHNPGCIVHDAVQHGRCWPGGMTSPARHRNLSRLTWYLQMGNELLRKTASTMT